MHTPTNFQQQQQPFLSQPSGFYSSVGGGPFLPPTAVFPPTPSVAAAYGIGLAGVTPIAAAPMTMADMASLTVGQADPTAAPTTGQQAQPAMQQEGVQSTAATTGAA